MGKQKQLLATQLTPTENQKLQSLIKVLNQKIQQEVEDKYPDDYNRTIMMDDRVT